MEHRRVILELQRNEITEHHIYKRLSASTPEPQNREVLRRIADDELRHYRFWRKYTGEDVPPARLKVWLFLLMSKVLGVTFAVKLLERGERKAQAAYSQLLGSIPEARSVIEDEEEHEARLIELVDEERLRYIGSVVLGLNDALVELTGALAGFTFALRETRLIAVTGAITGIAASLSMAASEYLSVKSEGGAHNPIKAAIYTGTTYILTVLLLILPYLIFSNVYLCLGITVLNAVLAISVFTFYISVAKGIPFRRRFFEMALISLGVAAVTFAVGFLIRAVLPIDAEFG